MSIDPIDIIEDVLDAASDGHLEMNEAKDIAGRVVDAALEDIDLSELIVEVAQSVGEFFAGDRPKRLRKRADRKRAKAAKLDAKADELDAKG